MFEKMKAMFKNDMAAVHPTAVPDAQLREMLRVYFMGFTAALKVSGSYLDGVELMSQARKAHFDDPNWWPDEDFKWWI